MLISTVTNTVAQIVININITAVEENNKGSVTITFAAYTLKQLCYVLASCRAAGHILIHLYTVHGLSVT